MSTSGCASDRLADDRAVAGDQVEHAGRQPDRVDDLGEDERVERRDLARLEHDRAAGGERRRDLGGDLVQRVVPRRDRSRPRRPARARSASCRPPPRTRSRSTSSRHRARTSSSAGPAWIMPRQRRSACRPRARSARRSRRRARRARRRSPRSSSARSSGGVCDQASNAARAAAHRAVDVLGGALAGCVPMTSSVVGLMTSIVPVAGGVDPLAADVELVADDAGSWRSPSVLHAGLRAVGGWPAAGLPRRSPRAGAVGERHDRDHRVGARGGRERARVADPHAGRVVQLAVAGSATLVCGSVPIRQVPIWWAENSRKPPARSGTRWQPLDEARRGRRRGASVGMPAASAAICARARRLVQADLGLDRAVGGCARRARVGRASSRARPGRPSSIVTRPCAVVAHQPDEGRRRSGSSSITSLCARRRIERRAPSRDRPVAYCVRLDQEAVAVLDVRRTRRRAPACGAPHHACMSSP